MNTNTTKKEFIHCKACGKRLIARLPDGSGEFIFGKKPDGGGFPPVRLKVWGLVQISCLSRRCDTITTLSFFPLIQPSADNNTNQDMKQSKADKAFESPVIQIRR